MTFKYGMFWIRTAGLFLYRSGRTTATLALMLMLAVATLIFLSSLAMGVNDTMIRNSVGLYSGHISGFALPASIPSERLQVDGTSSVLKRTSIPGMLLHQNRRQPAILIGVDPGAEEKSTAIWKKAIAGRYLRNNEKAIFLSQALAERLLVRPGSVLMFRSELGDTVIDLTVSGIYKTGLDAFDRELAFCPLSALPPKADTWSAAVFLKEGRDPDAVIAEYRRKLPAGLEFKSWKEMMPDLVQLIDLNYLSMSVVMVLVFSVVSVGIVCAFVIFILKNLREYGIMKAMGVTTREMILLILSEVLLMNFAACALGTSAGLSVVSMISHSGIDLGKLTSYNRYFTVSGIIYPRLTLYSLAAPPALAIFFSVISATWPVVLVCRKKAADILRMV
jgi:ABC-type lipoprotein release transport system permease subunit